MEQDEWNQVVNIIMTDQYEGNNCWFRQAKIGKHCTQLYDSTTVGHLGLPNNVEKVRKVSSRSISRELLSIGAVDVLYVLTTMDSRGD